MPTRETNADQTFRVCSSRDIQKLKFITKTVRESQRNGNDPWRQEDFWYTFHHAENLSLAFHRMLPHSQNRDHDQNKKKFLDAIRDLASTFDSQPEKALLARTEQMFGSLEHDGFLVEKFDLMTQWRMIVGLGTESVLETSMTLHPLYGSPYIPSSGVKGIARAYALYVENRACEKDDIRMNPNANPDEEAQLIFGAMDEMGKVVFFDGIPDAFPKLDVDLVNVHYQDYYSAKGTPQAPADWMSPVPSFFLAVAPDQSFHFFIASREPGLLKTAKAWLMGGLMLFGAGGKTSAGYGYFAEPNASASSTSDDLQNTRSLKEKNTLAPSTNITLSSRGIPAVVLDNSQKPIKVRLLASGYEDKTFPCNDVGNLADFPVGKEILVDVRSYDIVSKTIRMLGNPKLRK